MRWWLASVLANWAHSLTCRDGGDVWFEEFAIAYLRAHRPAGVGGGAVERSDHFHSSRAAVCSGSLSEDSVTAGAVRLAGE